MTARDKDARRALRKARRLDASLAPADYREAWRLFERLRKARQRRAPWDGGAFQHAAPVYLANYINDMGAARRAGHLSRWRGLRDGLNIWRGARGWLPR